MSLLKTNILKTSALSAIGLIAVSLPSMVAAKGDRNMSAGVKPAEFKKSYFKSDPKYKPTAYDEQAQRDIYGKKRPVDTTRPLLELGRPLYSGGPYKAGLPLHLVVYGDVQTAVGSNDIDGNQENIFALRANLDVDFKINSTERLHALIRPLDTANQPTQLDIDNDEFELAFLTQSCLEDDADCDGLDFFNEIFANLFFEGEFANKPVSFGKIPYVAQNGIWVEDAFLGGAFSIASQNSKTFDISNFDVSLFAAADDVNSRAFIDPSDAAVLGAALFLEMGLGYVEAGYGFVFDKNADVEDRVLATQDPAFQGLVGEGDLSYHNVTVSFARRYGFISNGIRLIGNLGQEGLTGADPNNENDEITVQSANGFALLIENSLITSKPLTFIPYFNFFVGIDSPQALIRQFGLLRNTGILFENNALTLQQSLFDNPDDIVGGAIGVEYLFALDQQIVVEVAGSTSICQAGDDNLLGNDCRSGNVAGLTVKEQAGVGLRYQLPFALYRRAWILRADGILGVLGEESIADDDSKTFFGARLELRRKF